MLEELRSITDARDRVVRQIAEAAARPGSLTSLHSLLDRWQGPEGARMRRHYDVLMTTAKRVREEIKLNVVLIENFRGFIEQALAAGASAMTDGKAYNRSGKPASIHPMSTVVYQQG